MSIDPRCSMEGFRLGPRTVQEKWMQGPQFSALYAEQYPSVSIHFNIFSKDFGCNLNIFRTICRFSLAKIPCSAYSAEQMDGTSIFSAPYADSNLVRCFGIVPNIHSSMYRMQIHCFVAANNFLLIF